VPAPFEVLLEEDIDHRECQHLAHHSASEGENVGVVVTAGKPCRELIPAQCCTDSMDLVGCDRLTLPAASYHYAPLRTAVHDRSPHRGAERRVVDRRLGIGTEVDHLIAARSKVVDDNRFQLEPCMIGSQGNPHPGSLYICPLRKVLLDSVTGMNDGWQRLLPRLDELRDLDSATALLHWDQAVMMPARGSSSRAAALGTVEGLAHTRLTDPELGERLADLAEDGGLDAGRAASVRVLRRAHDKAVRVPEKLVRELARVRAGAYQAWTQARPASDFGLLRPHLEQVVRLKKEEADALGYAGERYDALLDLYEPETTTSDVEGIFELLVSGLRPLVDDVLGAIESRPEWLSQPFEEAQQQIVCRWLAERVGFDLSAGRLDLSPHPFTSHIGFGDVRQTIRTEANALLPSLYATMHETGHALYEQGLPEELSGLPAGSAPSLGIHESQSRLWENIVGRSRAFTDFLLPHLKERFPTQLGKLTPDEFNRGVNHPERTLIRVYADELTYNLHVALRLELELALFRDQLDVADLPEAWDAGMEKHIGVRPDSLGDGVLQDVHWSMGLHGYFPTYTLGTLYAAAFYEKAESELGSLDDDLRAGETGRLLEWLRTNIHSQAYLYPARELAERVLGRPLTTGPLLAYLEDKYRTLFVT
jgi:carboxypeptidase Taq